MLLSVLGAAGAQKEGTVQGGAQRTFSVNDLTNDRLGRIVASSNYQISIVLPAEVQNVGINASKQSSLVPTVDQSDGRVMYLDVLKPGGYATLNIRLVSEGEPVILKLTVELGQGTSGVLTYTITTAQQPTQSQAPRVTASAPVPTPAPRAMTTPTVRPVAPAAATVPVQATPREASPAVASPIRPMPADQRRALTPVPVPTVQAATPAARPVQSASPAVRPVQSNTPVARLQDSLHIEVSVAPSQSGDRTVTYRIRDVLSTDGLTYILAPKVTVRPSGRGQAHTAATTPNLYQRVTESGIQGTFTMNASALSAQGTAVVMFEVRPVDTRSQRSLPARYLGVVVRP